jgi:hypothetical protein
LRSIVGEFERVIMAPLILFSEWPQVCTITM